ncbi:hypothetical protein PR202_ga21542 [Eleusine coracana subsp. coracana]|uniref:BTB domain-containing protein n=1 Tax=Eleusine coracana subsp. coracana TaxID=191504 RepID=A0AAV5D1A8_ELECO|nr:hypothetical protein PR202_ga21542 [Eleusine coracana subsp. coracana]
MERNAYTLGSADTSFVKIKLGYSEFKSLPTGVFISEHISTGGLNGEIFCFPRGINEEPSNNGEYFSLAVMTSDKPTNVMKSIFHAFVMGRDGTPSSCREHTSSCEIIYGPGKDDDTVTGVAAWEKFMKRSKLESDYLVNGCITFICGITVLHDSRSSVPPPDLGNHLGNLLDCTDGSDVSFSVGGEIFRAHQAILAARSPVFKAQLFGSMADAKMDCITLHDIQPAIFQILLKFIYTDALPADKVLDSSSSSSAATELLLHLLAAADMYHLERLQHMCAHKLCDHVTVENVATMLGCAETHCCPELKNRCMDFFMVEKNFKKAVLTEGYLRLMQGFPSIIDEMRARVQT